MTRFWVPLVLVTVAPAASIEQNAAVSFRVYDYAGLSREDVLKMAEEASQVLARAGIRTQWFTCYGAAGTFTPAAQCESPGGSTTFVLRIVPTSPGWRERLGDQALGFALVTNEGGSLATLFLDQIDKLAEKQIAPRESILGHAAAHEVGHLLLVSTEHARIGIMRAQWGWDSLQLMKEKSLVFSKSERARMLRNIAARAAH